MTDLVFFAIAVFLAGTYFGLCLGYVVARWNQRLEAWGRQRIETWFANQAMKLKKW